MYKHIIYGPGRDNYGRDKPFWENHKHKETIDKLAEEILDKINDNHFTTYSRGEVLQAMQEYLESNLKEELIKFYKERIYTETSAGNMSIEQIIDEYLKQRNNK